MYCVMLYSVYCVMLYSMYCVMLYSVYCVRLYSMYFVMLYSVYCVMFHRVCRQTVPVHIYIHTGVKQLLHFICRISFISCLVLTDFV